MREYEFLLIIQYTRLKKNLFQKDMARLLNISKSSYSKLERGEKKLNYENIKKIAEILDIDLNIIKDKTRERNVYYD